MPSGIHRADNAMTNGCLIFLNFVCVCVNGNLNTVELSKWNSVLIFMFFN